MSFAKDLIGLKFGRLQAEKVLHGEWSGEINRKDFRHFVNSKVKKDVT